MWRVFEQAMRRKSFDLSVTCSFEERIGHGSICDIGCHAADTGLARMTALVMDLDSRCAE